MHWHATRLQILYSAQPYCISEEQLGEITTAEPEPKLAFLHGASKSALQKLRYNLWGQVRNLFNEKVFMKSGSHPADIVRLHLGLKNTFPEKGFMDM
jgi:hypothetical protein